MKKILSFSLFFLPCFLFLPIKQARADCIETAIGCIDVETPTAFVNSILTLAITIGGGIAFLLIIFGAFLVLTSAGNPEKVKAGKELITSAIAGLLLIIFAVFILRLVGAEILQIPGFD